MAELMEHVQALADDIGPRPVSTEEEHQASLYVAQNLQEAGLEVDIDEFATPTGVRWPYALSFALIMLGTLLSGFGKFVPGLSTTFYAVGLLFVVAALFFYFTEYMGRPILSKALTRGVSQNVVARYVPSSVARERRRRKIIFVAHVDTVRAQPEAMPALVNIMPVLKKAIYYCMIAIGVMFVVRMLPLPWPDTVDFVLWIISLVLGVFLLICALCIVINRFMPYVSGANDNASSIAVLIGLARRLLDPAERERYAKGDDEEGPADVVYDENGEEIPVETFQPVQDEGTFDPDAVEPVIHGEEAAAAAGVIPDGADLAYADGIVNQPAGGGETVAFPSLGAADDVSAVAPVIPAPEPSALEEASSAAAAPHPDQTPAEPAAVGQQPAPVVEFAPAAAPVAAPAAPARPAPVPAPKREANAANLPSWYTTAKRKAAAAEAAAEEQNAAAEENVRSQYAGIPATREQARALQARRQVETQAEKGYGEEGQAMIEAIQNRSVDDILVDLGVDPEEMPTNSEPAAESAAAPAAEKPEAEDAVPAAADAAPAAGDKAAQPQPDDEEFVVATPIDDSEADAQDEPARDNVISLAAFKGELAEADVDDLDPDFTGTFDAVEEIGGFAENRIGLTGRIPVIGDDDAASAFATYAAVDSGDALSAEDAEPEFGTDDAQEPVEQSEEQPSGLAAGLTGSFKALQARRAAAKEAKAAAQAAQPKRNAKPTQRRVSDDFEPTKVSGRHADAADMLSESRQAAAVVSEYQGTIQAAPQATQSFDPFAPKGDPAANASLISPSVSTAFPAVNPGLSAEFPVAGDTTAAIKPGATSSFPCLTGTFPSLSGSAGSFDASSFEQPTASDFDDSDLEPFNGFAPDVDVHIDAPASRMHGFMDKVGGLFKFGKKKKEEELGFDDGWNDEDNGWKGGAYFDEKLAADSHAAVRARAAQIRESVVSMTENDLLDKEVWFVALGASNAGNRGMKNFLELHKSELRGALIVNLEGVGAGDICFVDYEGLRKTRRSDRRLQSLVRKASKELDGVEMSAERLDWRDTDATPAMEAGCRAMTIMGFDGVAPMGWHWTNDYAGIVEEEKLEYVTGVLMKMVENS